MNAKCRISDTKWVNIPIEALIIVSCVIGLCAYGCDTNFLHWSPPPNYVKSWSACDEYNYYVSGYYAEDGEYIWIVLHWEGTGMLGRMRNDVLICGERHASTMYMDKAIITFKHGYNFETELYQNDTDAGYSLSCQYSKIIQKGNSLVIMYNGPIVPIFQGGSNCTWLRLEVPAKINAKMTRNVMKNLRPLIIEKESLTSLAEKMNSYLNQDSSKTVGD